MNVDNLISVVISEQVPFLRNNFSTQFLRAHESYFRAEILIRIVSDEAYAIDKTQLYSNKVDSFLILKM